MGGANLPRARSASDTPARLIGVASKLFAERSVDAVSIRAITRAAEVGSASVHYHFKTKDALLDAVLARHCDAVLTDIARRERQLLADPEAPTATQIIECIAGPFHHLLTEEPESGGQWLHIVGQLVVLDDDRAAYGADETNRLLRKLVSRAFPRAPAWQREAATRVAVTALVAFMGQLRPAVKSASPSPIAATPQQIVHFVAGGLTRSIASAASSEHHDEEPASQTHIHVSEAEPAGADQEQRRFRSSAVTEPRQLPRVEKSRAP